MRNRGPFCCSQFANSSFWRLCFYILSIRLQIIIFETGLLMKNKYIILAVLPILFQGNLYSKDKYADLDAIIINELRSAQKAMDSSAKLELEPILHSLVSFARKTDNNRQVAIDKILGIQKVLQVCKSEKYKTNWELICSYFSSNPEIVIKQIDPALAKVHKALADLKVTTFEYRYALRAIAAAAVVGVSLVVASVAAYKKPTIRKSSQDFDDDNLRNLTDAALADEQAGRNPLAAGQGDMFAFDVERYPGQFSQGTVRQAVLNDSEAFSGVDYNSL